MAGSLKLDILDNILKANRAIFSLNAYLVDLCLNDQFFQQRANKDLELSAFLKKKTVPHAHLHKVLLIFLIYSRYLWKVYLKNGPCFHPETHRDTVYLSLSLPLCS